MTGGSGGDGATRTNSRKDSHCYNCGGTDHWAYECPRLSSEQQAQLDMTVERNEGAEEEHEAESQGHQLLNVALAQGGALKDLKEIWTVRGGIKINCNAGAVSTNQIGRYGNLEVWYIPDGIANIFLMHELEKKYRIT